MPSPDSAGIVARKTALVAETEIWPTPPASLLSEPKEEVGDARGEDRQRKAGHVLVCAQGDGQYAVDQAAERGSRDTAYKRDDEAEHGARLRDRAFIGEGARKARDAAEVHDARHAEVEVSGFFRQDLADRAEEDHAAESDSRLKQSNKLCHAFASFVLRPRKTRR